MTTLELLEAIARERARLMSAIDELGAGAATVIVTDEGEGWTAKDVLAHHVHYMDQIAVGLGVENLRPPQYVIDNAARRPGGDEWNALAVEASRPAPMADVRRRFDAVADAIAERVRLRSDDEINVVGALPWAGQQPLWQLVAGDTFVHWSVHRADIERAAQRAR